MSCGTEQIRAGARAIVLVKDLGRATYIHLQGGGVRSEQSAFDRRACRGTAEAARESRTAFITRSECQPPHLLFASA